MTFIKKLKSKFKLSLRRKGLLCKRPIETRKRIRIAKTINTDGSVTKHSGQVYTQPIQEGSTFETELHIWKEIHKDKFINK